MKNRLFCVFCAAVLALCLTGCSFSDVMLYLYGGDEWVQADEEPVYARCEADNGVTVLYDTNIWEAPVMAQEDTVSLTAGNQLNYTAVLLQRTDSYTDFLAQSGAELAETTKVGEYALDFTLPGVEVQAVRYDCGSYQTIFAELGYPGGDRIYVTAATRQADYQRILDLLATVYPTGQTPESAAGLDAPDVSALNGEKQQSYA